jgi:hypothetical protein
VAGVPLTPESCPGPPRLRHRYASQGASLATLKNTGTTPLLYVVRFAWVSGVSYQPGVANGGQEKVGVLAAGETVQALSYGITGLLGSARSFAPQGEAAGRDEALIPWPDGVANPEGATHMYIAQVELRSFCDVTGQYW